MINIVSIRQMVLEDVSKVARVHEEVFVRQTLSRQWISCNFQAFPRIRYFVAEVDQDLVGYIQWTEKSGFRADVVLELEQIAVMPSMQNKKIGTALILHSLPRLCNFFWLLSQIEPPRGNLNSQEGMFKPIL